VPDSAFPVDFALLEDAHRWVSSYEFARNRRWEIDHHWDAISTFLRENRIHDGLTCRFETYRAARDLLERCRLQMDLLFTQYDVLQVPAAGGEAPIGLSSTGNIVFCTSWSALHVPALSLPLYQGPNGLPVGVQFVAKRGHDRALFAASKSIMQAANQRR
jgi:Asp-tRNA(Asn)/Glu-tRNA(Gln) amidotransferase A subunit family amidase